MTIQYRLENLGNCDTVQTVSPTMPRWLPQLFVLAFTSLSAISTGALACGTEPAAPRPTAAGSAVRQQCDGRGEHSIAVEGDGFGAYEGKRVWLSALEPGRVAAVVEGRVSGGKIRLSCAKSLHTSGVYPSIAVVIDTDNDGRCGPSDHQSRSIMYGWNANVSHRVEAQHFGPVKNATPDHAGFDYCSAHFPK